MRQQRVGRDVERHTEENVGAALVELAGELPAGDIELEQRVAWGQLHAWDIADVPGRHDQPARIRVAANLREHLRQLIDMPAVRRGP